MYVRSTLPRTQIRERQVSVENLSSYVVDLLDFGDH